MQCKVTTNNHLVHNVRRYVIFWGPREKREEDIQGKGSEVERVRGEGEGRRGGK